LNNHELRTTNHEPPLRTLSDLIVHGAARFRAAGIGIGHSQDNALDEARSLVAHALHLPSEVPVPFAAAKLLDDEIAAVLALFDRRIAERIPAAYLIGTAAFAGLRLRSDARALVPRSPIAELIETGFAAHLSGRKVQRVLDLCTGGGSIALAMAVQCPQWQIDAVDLSPGALELAAENRALLGVVERVRLIESDLFAELTGQRYDLLVSNPPYITSADYAAMPAEYAHEPRLGLESGADGLDATLRILRDAPAYLSEHALLVIEVGEAERALRRLLPRLAIQSIEFSVGWMGVFALEATDLRREHAAVAALCAARGL
jgi:ribosomal protein L3 glutamine methyltransferase